MSLPMLLSDFTDSEIEDVMSILQEELSRRRQTSLTDANESGNPKSCQTVLDQPKKEVQVEIQLVSDSKTVNWILKPACDLLGELLKRIEYKPWEEETGTNDCGSQTCCS